MTKKALTLALEALKLGDTVFYPQTSIAIAAIEGVLAQPEQEPVAYIRVSKTGHVMACAKTGDFYSLPHKTLLYTTPPQRKPLTDEEIGAILEGVNAYGTRLYTFARAIEAVHGIKENMNLQMNLAGIRADFEEKLQRTWVGLTTDDWDEIKKQVKYNFEMTTGEYAERVSYLVENKLREKNT